MKISIKTIGLIFFLSSSVFAQKQSGSISNIQNQKNTKAQVNSFAVKNSKPNVVKAISNDKKRSSSDDVRFLLRPKFEVIMASKMSGTINDIQFNIGQRFKKGDTLVQLGCGVQNARVQMQRAKVRESALNYKSNKELLAGNAGSKYEVNISKSQLDQENALLRESNILAGFCKIKAPFDGGVTSVLVDKFESIDSSTPLIKVIDDSELLMSLNIPSKLISTVKNNSIFTVEVDETGNAYKAKVIGVSPAIDPVSKTIELRAVLVNKTDALKPGMSGKAILKFS